MSLSWLETLLATSIPLLIMLMLMLISDYKAKADADAFLVGNTAGYKHPTLVNADADADK